MMRSLVTFGILSSLGLANPLLAADIEGDLYHVGTAKVDITPKTPVRLNGFGGRRTESEGVNHPIHVRALSIRHSEEKTPLVLLTVDVLGIPADLRAELVKRLKDKVPSENLAVTATHTHCGPMLKGANPTLFGVPIPEDHQKHIDEYTSVFLDKLEEAVLTSLTETKPCRISWGVGSVGFARNRRTNNGPTDHDLPVLVAVDAETKKVRAVHTSYACHCVTLSHNKLGGDWAGYAAEAIEGHFPQSVALVSIGCGADQNPDSGVTGDKVETARVQGRAIAAEIQRLTRNALTPLRGKPTCVLNPIDLPLANLPDRAKWDELAKRQDAVGHHARVQIGKLDRKETLAAKIDYPVQTWTFGDSLALVHLPGEVVVDYATRLKSELDRSRLWVVAYANNNPCYIPSERILKEGGYEGGGAMVYYDLPVAFRPGLEARIIDEVKRQLGKKFDSPSDPEKLPGSKPLSPAQSLASILVDAKFAVDLVAAEPLVASPVAVNFGPDGKLWVAEMLDYPSGKTGKFEPGGRVRFLEDADGDGRFDKATTFVEGIPFPTGVLPWRKGMLICAAPDILYAEDTNGDGKADRVEKLYSGFGTENYQARVNGLAYGLDGWVYGSCGLFGGQIVSKKTGKTLALGDRDFRIKPDTGEIEPATGRTQHGRVRDDWDNWFGCDNSNLGWHYVLSESDLRRNPFVAPPNPVVSLVNGPDGNRLFPIHSPQLFQLSGPAGRPTAACGIGIYRDDRLGNLSGNSFTCEPVNNLVHRRVLKPSGTRITSERDPAEKNREFLTSRDPWFRPVQAITGPDGGLWVVDMYRFVIEHPRWIPPADLAKLDVRAGHDLGRIYRVRPAEGEPRSWPRLDKLDAAGLVAALDSPNGWQRDMATEMLVWGEHAAAVPHLLKLLRESNRREARLHALVAVERLGGLKPEILLPLLSDPHPGLRRHAVRFAEGFASDSAILLAVGQLADDPDARVRLQVACTLGRSKEGEILAKLAVADRNDPYLLAAVLSSLNRDNFKSFAASPGLQQLAETSFFPRLIATAIGLGDETTVTALLRTVTKPVDGKFKAWQYAAVETVIDSLARTAKKVELPEEARVVLRSARGVALDPKAGADLRIAAVRLLALDRDRLTDTIADLGGLLVPQTPAPVQAAAVDALGRIDDERCVPALLSGWDAYSPAVQSRAIDVLLNRDAWMPKVLAALGEGKLPVSAIPAGERQWLLTHTDKSIQSLAEKVFAGAINRDRQKVIDAYRPDVTKGDSSRGKAVFAKSCSPCHQLDGAGQAVGPDLSVLANKSPDYLLAEILDPNRNLDNRYLEYRIVTVDGRSLAGLVASESANALTLRQAEGKETTLLRNDIESQKSTAKSLMPEGFEKEIAPQAMADLVAYLGSVGRPPKAQPGNTPRVARLSDGELTLRASEAEIRGDAIVFETEFGNVGFWHGLKDHVVWKVELDRDGEFDLYLDAACDAGSAGNAFAVDGVDPPVRGKVASTGGWSKYRWVKLGTVKLPKGPSRITFRPDGETLRGALLDLRTLSLVQKGSTPKSAPEAKSESPTGDDPVELAKFVLDDSKKSSDREAVVAKHADQSARLIRAMTAELAPGKEEYRRIPWIWRCAIGAGKRNRDAEIVAILAVSLPHEGEALRDWQAVVLGGGIVNGVSQTGVWPRERIEAVLGKEADLAKRWRLALEASLKMADDEKVPTGTRYDALRMLPLLGWEKSGKTLVRYLAKGTNAELQMGAVSGSVDVDSPEATKSLVEALGHLTGENRTLALRGLLRSEGRCGALLDAVESGSVKSGDIDTAVVAELKGAKWESIRTRAVKVLGGK